MFNVYVTVTYSFEPTDYSPDGLFWNFRNRKFYQITNRLLNQPSQKIPSLLYQLISYLKLKLRKWSKKNILKLSCPVFLLWNFENPHATVAWSLLELDEKSHPCNDWNCHKRLQLDFSVNKCSDRDLKISKFVSKLSTF